ncbi:MAG: hypothetical protein LBT50_03375 [Prevotellaceae bacterium]|jgi:hypothetical protein|nr:hypothetical protein [Prevotellaceae bacterium]
MEKLYLEFSDDLKRYLNEHEHDVASILRSSGYSISTKNADVAKGITVIDLSMVIASASASGVVSGVIADIFKAIWKRFNALFGSSRMIIFIDEEKENVVINKYGEVNMDAINEAKTKDIRIKVKESE